MAETKKAVPKTQDAVERLSEDLSSKSVALHGPADLPSDGQHADDPLLKPREVAAILDVHVVTVHRNATKGWLPFIRIGKGGKRFRKSTILAEVPAINAPANSEKE